MILTIHYNAHSGCFQLFKTKEIFLIIKICSQQENEFNTVVEVSLPFIIFVYYFFITFSF